VLSEFRRRNFDLSKIFLMSGYLADFNNVDEISLSEQTDRIKCEVQKTVGFPCRLPSVMLSDTYKNRNKNMGKIRFR